MKTLYLDCGMGAAGDMLMAALLEICPDRASFLETMNHLGLPGVCVEAEPASKCGIVGTHMEITVNGVAEESADVGGESHKDVCHRDDPEHDHGESVHDHGESVHHHGESVHYHGESVHDHGESVHHHGESVHDHDDFEHDHGESRHHHGESVHDHDDFEHHHGESGHYHGESVHDHDDFEHHHGESGHHGHSHHHSGMADIARVITGLNIPEDIKKDVENVYRMIAEAESHAHGKPVDEIHFHEVGSMDAIADVTGVCLLMAQLSPDRVLASPVHVGSGHVRCAHGVMPVPAPATAHLLKNVPVYSTEVRGELCTPTGAALLKYFVADYGAMPVMAVSKIGYGMGKKDFERANCVRAFWGETEDGGDEIVELVCNLDDMTPEDIGFAQEAMFEAGALDVYTVAAGMKKNRPGVVFTCLCRAEDEKKMAELIFRHTTTLGLRRHVSRRFTMKRSQERVETPYGPVRVKRAFGYGTEKCKAEYEDLAKIAREQGVPLTKVRGEIK